MLDPDRESRMEPSRAKHIDIAKGLSIAMVAMFHSELNVYFPDIIEPMSLFRMPLFFLLSGVFFGWIASPKDFLMKKSEALLKPYFSLLLILLFFSLFLGDNASDWQLKGILYGNGYTIKRPWIPLWFLTHLFTVYVFSYVLFRYTNLYKLSIGIPILLLLFMVIGSTWIDYFWYREVHLFSRTIKLPGLPFSLDIVLITSCYFILGRLIKNSLIKFRPTLLLFSLSLSAFLIISQLTSAHIDLNERVYDSPVFATLAALCGIYIVLSLSHIISKSYWLSFIPLRLGQASLYILIFHSFIMSEAFSYLSSLSFISESYFICLAFITFGLGIFIPLIIKWFVEKNSFLSLFFLPLKSNKFLQRTLYARR